MEYTAYLMKSVPITVVDLWVADVGFLANDTAGVPECCHPRGVLQAIQLCSTLSRFIAWPINVPKGAALGEVGDINDLIQNDEKFAQ